MKRCVFEIDTHLFFYAESPTDLEFSGYCNEVLEALKIFGSILGLAAFFWKIWDAFKSYLHIYVEVESSSNKILLIKTRVENRSLCRKKIENALLLIGPEDEEPVETFNSTVPGEELSHTNDIAEHRIEGALYGEEGRAVIPLPFFYSENIQIGDESSSYTAVAATSTMVSGKPYAIRFYIFDRNRLHRFTEDTFIIERP